MTRRHTPAILAAAAGMMLSGAAWAQQEPAGQAQPGQAQPGQAQPGQAQPGQAQGQRQQPAYGQQEQQRAQRGEGQQMRGGGGMQVTQQIRQFAQDPNTAADKLFVLMAGLANQEEIEFARLAQQQAQNEQVKQIAQQMMRDHQQAQQQLQQVAQQLGVQLPQQLPPMQQATLEVYRALPADQLEKQYIAHLQAGHAKDITKFQSVAQTAQNEQVKQYAQQMLPTFAQHQQSVMQTAQAMGLPTAGLEAVPAAGRIQGGDATGAGQQQRQGQQGQQGLQGGQGLQETQGQQGGQGLQGGQGQQ